MHVRIRSIVDGITTLAILAACAVLLVAYWPRIHPPVPSVPRTPVSIARAAVRGEAEFAERAIDFDEGHSEPPVF
jgi:hypothetical protein